MEQLRARHQPGLWEYSGEQVDTLGASSTINGGHWGKSLRGVQGALGGPSKAYALWDIMEGFLEQVKSQLRLGRKEGVKTWEER